MTKSIITAVLILISTTANLVLGQYNPCNDENILSYYVVSSISVDNGSYNFSVTQWYHNDNTYKRLFQDGFLSRDNLYHSNVRERRYKDALMSMILFTEGYRDNTNNMLKEYLSQTPSYLQNSLLGDLLKNYLVANIDLKRPLTEIESAYKPTDDLIKIKAVLNKLEANNYIVDKNDQEIKNFFKGNLPEKPVPEFGKYTKVIKGYEKAGQILDLAKTSNKIIFNSFLVSILVNEAAVERYFKIENILQSSSLGSDPALLSALSETKKFLDLSSDQQFYKILFEEVIANSIDLGSGVLSIADVTIKDVVFKKVIEFAAGKGLTITKAMAVNATIGLVALKVTFDVIKTIYEQVSLSEESIIGSTLADELCNYDNNKREISELTAYAYYYSTSRLLASNKEVSWDWWNNDVESQIQNFHNFIVDIFSEVINAPPEIVVEQLYPDFNADVKNGDMPLKVTFENTSTPTDKISSWKWDLTGNGIIDSYDQEPVFIYNNVGNYSVSLTVSDGQQEVTEKKDNYITVSDPNSGNDLAVKSILIEENKTQFERGESFKVYGTIDNVGENSANNIPVLFALKNAAGETVDDQTSSISLAPGAVSDPINMTLRVPFDAPDGNYTVEVSTQWTNDGNPVNNFKIKSVYVGEAPTYTQYKFNEIGFMYNGERGTYGGYIFEVLNVNSSAVKLKITSSTGTVITYDTNIQSGGYEFFDDNKLIINNIKSDYEKAYLDYATPSNDITVTPNKITVDAGSKGFFNVSTNETRTRLGYGYGPDMDLVDTMMKMVNSSGTDFQIEVNPLLNATRKTYEFWPKINNDYLQVLKLEVHEPRNVRGKSLSVATDQDLIIGNRLTFTSIFVNDGGYALSNVPIEFIITGPNNYEYIDYDEGTFGLNTEKDFTFDWNTDEVSIGEYTITAVAVVPDDPYNNNSVSTTISLKSPPAPDQPVLNSPGVADSKISLNPIFDWETTLGATSYNLQLSLNENFSDTLKNILNINESTYNGISLNGLTNYYWRVRARNDVDYGGWSEIWNFMTMEAPSVSKLIVTNDLIEFGNVSVNQDSVLAYNLSGSDLSSGINITVDGSFKVSEKIDTDFKNSLTFLPDSEGKVGETTIYVKFTPTIENLYTGTISHSSEGADTKEINLSGTGVSTVVPIPELVSLTVDTSSVMLGESFRVTIIGKNNGSLSDFGSITLSLPQFTSATDAADYSTNVSGAESFNTYNSGEIVGHKNGDQVELKYAMFELEASNWQEGEQHVMELDVTPKETGTFTIYARVNMRDASGNYINDPDSSEFTDQQGWLVVKREVKVDSTASLPNFAIPAVPIEFGNVQVGQDSVLSYNISGNNLAGSVNLNTSDGFTISKENDSGFDTSLSLNPDSEGNVVETPIYVKFTPNAEQPYTGTISHSSEGADTKEINLSGTGVSTVVPIPELVSLTVDTSSVMLGESFRVTIIGKNNGSLSDFGSITLSLPQFTSATDATDYSTNVSGAESFNTYNSGEIVGHKNGEQVELKYAMFELGDTNWQEGEQHIMELDVTPKDTGTFTIYARVNMKDASGNYKNDPGESIQNDQQGWPVKVITLTVTQNGLAVWPGDTSNDGLVDSKDVLPLGLYYGQERPGENNSGNKWQAYHREFWIADGNIPSRIYADANGDGVIDSKDVLAIGLNYSKTHEVENILTKISSESPATQGALKLELLEETEQLAIFGLYAETEASVYGISSKLDFDSDVSAIDAYDITVPDEAFGKDALVFSEFPEDASYIDLAASRTTEGELYGDYLMQIELTHNLNIGERFSLNPTDILAMNPAGEEIHLEGEPLIYTVGQLVSNGISAETPEAYELFDNYPNPFNPLTQISYSLPEEGQVRLSVYTMTGQLVKVLVNKRQQAGIHRVTFNAENLSSGVYLYRMETESYTATKKLTLIK